MRKGLRNGHGASRPQAGRPRHIRVGHGERPRRAAASGSRPAAGPAAGVFWRRSLCGAWSQSGLSSRLFGVEDKKVRVNSVAAVAVPDCAVR